MKPDKPGIWEWFDENGVKRLVEVVDVNSEHRNLKGGAYLRVYFWGGYYDVHDSFEDIYNAKGKIVERNRKTLAEWPDRWGKRVADNNGLPEEQLYLIPDWEKIAKIRREDAMRAMRKADFQGELDNDDETGYYYK